MSAEKKFVVLTAVGTDRSGLVRGLSAMIHEHGANIEDSRMAILGGEFAIVMMFSGSADAVSAVQQASGKVGDELGLTLSFKETAQTKRGDGLAYRLRVSGLDTPGIVERVTQVLSRFEINVAALDTSVVHAPMTGTPTFVLEADIDVPPSSRVNKLREALVVSCEEANLDCVLEPRLSR